MISEWWKGKRRHDVARHWMPTVYGFTDFGMGSNPWQEFGWSGWAFPEDIYNPLSYDHASVFNDAPGNPEFSNLHSPFEGIGGSSVSTVIEPDSTTRPTLMYPVGVCFRGVGLAVEFVGVYVDGTFEAHTGAQIKAKTAHALTTAFNANLATSPLAPHASVVNAGVSDKTDLREAMRHSPLCLVSLNDIDGPILGEMLFRITDDYSGVPDDSDYQWVQPQWTETLRNPSLSYTMTQKSAIGPRGGVSYCGPLHYGISKTGHPFRTDSAWTQVHAGLGYDLPIHYLSPGRVAVRARASGSGTLALEFETPFHLTDTKHLLAKEMGLTALTSAAGSDRIGFDPLTGGAELGQWSLNANLWNLRPSPPTLLRLPDGYDTGLAGPLQTEKTDGGSNPDPLMYRGSLETSALQTLWWVDHPTDRFHAGAIPITRGTDHDPNLTGEYIFDFKKHHPIDFVSQSEQLISSTEVHINLNTEPFWDSGSIITANVAGKADGTYPLNHVIDYDQATKTGTGLNWNAYGTSSTPNAANWKSSGLGMGQRVVRTVDGTLHTFVMQRNTESGKNAPIWTHYKKPEDSDYFWNKKGATSAGLHTAEGVAPTPTTATATTRDVLGIPLEDVSGSTSVSSFRQHGIAVASDSRGNLHAVISQKTINHEDDFGGMSLVYCYGERRLVSMSPRPVYDWDWDISSPNRVVIYAGSQYARGQYDVSDFETHYRPSIVIDSKDNIHLTWLASGRDFSHPTVTSGFSWNRLMYVTKPAEPSFAWPDINDSRVRCVNDWDYTKTNDVDGVMPVYCREPLEAKIMLTGDDKPVVVWRGTNGGVNAGEPSDDCLWVSVGEMSGSIGGWSFDNEKQYWFVSAAHNTVAGGIPAPVWHWDAIIDHRDILWATSHHSSVLTVSPGDFDYRLTRIDLRQPLADQYTTTDGVGTSKTLMTNTATSTSERYDFGQVNMTTDGRGHLHIVGAMSIADGSSDGNAANNQGALYKGLENVALWYRGLSHRGQDGQTTRFIQDLSGNGRHAYSRTNAPPNITSRAVAGALNADLVGWRNESPGKGMTIMGPRAASMKAGFSMNIVLDGRTRDADSQNVVFSQFPFAVQADDVGGTLTFTITIQNLTTGSNWIRKVCTSTAGTLQDIITLQIVYDPTQAAIDDALRVYVNGTLETNGATGTAPAGEVGLWLDDSANANIPPTLLALPNGLYPCTLLLCEFMLIQGLMSDPDRTAVYDYFGYVWRNGAPADNPIEPRSPYPLVWPGTPMGDIHERNVKNPWSGVYERASEFSWWAGERSTAGSGYNAIGQFGTHYPAHHLFEISLPSVEFDATADPVIRSMNFRWLSTPSMKWDSTAGWQPTTQQATFFGAEDFPHWFPHLRYQRHHGGTAQALDLVWFTTEHAWKHTPHRQSRMWMPDGNRDRLSGNRLAFTAGADTRDGVPGYNAAWGSTNPGNVSRGRLIAWWQNEDIQAMADGSTMTTWRDSSGRANHLTGYLATGSGSGGGPTVVYNAIGNMPALEFDGNMGMISDAAAAGQTPQVPSELTVFAVVKDIDAYNAAGTAGTSLFRAIVGREPEESTTRRGWSLQISSHATQSKPFAVIGSHYGATGHPTTQQIKERVATGPPAGNAIILMMRYNAGTLDIVWNTLTTTQSDVTTASFSHMLQGSELNRASFFVGARHDSTHNEVGNGFAGSIGEIAVFNSALSDAAANAIGLYYRDKFTSAGGWT